MVFILLLPCAIGCYAQSTVMRVHHSSGMHTDIPTAQIDSITFAEEGSDDSTVVMFTGSWLWGDTEQGYYELLTFNEDRTYTGYDNYFSYGFDTTTFGWYSRHGAMLTLRSNGFGYQRRYDWYVTALTENALEVMTRMGPFTYYRLQNETIMLKAGDSADCEEGDSFVFADGVVAQTEDGCLHALAPGTTYVVKQLASSNTMLAYKVVVE